MATRGEGDRWLNLYRSVSVIVIGVIGSLLAYIADDIRSTQKDMAQKIGAINVNFATVAGHVEQNMANIERIDTSLDNAIVRVNGLDVRVTRIEARR